MLCGKVRMRCAGTARASLVAALLAPGPLSTPISHAGREQVAKEPGITLQQILDHRPSASTSGVLLRELAAIHR